MAPKNAKDEGLPKRSHKHKDLTNISTDLVNKDIGIDCRL